MTITSFDSALRSAAAAAVSGRDDDAIKIYEQLLSAASPHPAVFNAAGIFHLQRGRHQQAIDLLQRAVERDPRAIALHLNLAHAFELSGRTAEEEKSVDAALAIDRTNVGALMRRAELYQDSNEAAAAATHWEAALAQIPPDARLAEEVAARLERGRDFLFGYRQGFRAAMENGLAPLLDGAPALARRRCRALLDHQFAGRRYYANDCEGLYYPFLPPDEYFDREHFPWLEKLEAQTSIIRDELLALADDPSLFFAPYVQQAPGLPQNKWSPLDGSLDWSACFLWKYGDRDQPAAARCPRTVELLSSLPLANIHARAPSAFFSMLRPHAHIPPHTGVTNARATVHLPLVVPGNCHFRVGGETREWRVGEAWVFDDTIEHEAWNHSDEARIILIFDVWNPHLTVREQELIGQFFATADQIGNVGRSAAVF